MRCRLEVRGEEASVSWQLCGSALGCVGLSFQSAWNVLQLSIAPNKALYESTSTEISRLAIAKNHEISVKERSLYAFSCDLGEALFMQWISSFLSADVMNPSLPKVVLLSLLIHLGCDLLSLPFSTCTRGLCCITPTFVTYRSMFRTLMKLRTAELYQGSSSPTT